MASLHVDILKITAEVYLLESMYMIFHTMIKFCYFLRYKFILRKGKKIYLPNIRKGAAKFSPINSNPQYTVKPKAAATATADEKHPSTPSQGLLFTQSIIIHVDTEKASMITTVTLNRGNTEIVFFSSSADNVSDV